MATERNPWLTLVEAIKDLSPGVRMKWSGDDSPPAWERWLIVPTDGYLETGRVGPVPFREVEWVELDSRQKSECGRLVVADQTAELLVALKKASLDYQMTNGVVRINATAG
jgi:hypothetical protein